MRITSAFKSYLRRVDKARRAQHRAKNRFVAANLRLVVSIARRYNVDMHTIQRANCLPSYALDAGDTLYVPPGASVSLPKEYPAPVLLFPEDGANFPPAERVELRWRWEGELGEHEHFDVRLWKEGAPNYGVGWSKEEHYAVEGDPGVTYYWSVAVIYGKDGQMVEQLSPESPPLEISWGHPE